MPGIYGTRLLFSGVESRRLLDTFTSFQIPHVQLSYYYLRKVFSDPGEASLALKPFSTVVIDHGLIYHKYKSEPERKAFLEGYYEYVTNLQPQVYTACVAHIDLDMDKMIDTDKLIYPLEDLEELMEGDIKSIFSNIDYVGLSNKVATTEDRMSALCSQALKYGTKLHAFGTASQQVLKKWPIYTANTSSWRTGSRYANIYLYEGQGRGLRLYQPTDKSDLAKTEREKKNYRVRQKAAVETKQSYLYSQVNWEAVIEDDDSWEVDKANLTQWMLYQRDLGLEGRKAYWLTDEEKHTLLEDRKALVAGTTTKREETQPSEVVHAESAVSGEIVGQEIIPHTGAVLGAPSDRKKRLREVDDRLLQPRMCDNCILANRCPKYEPSASCSFGLTDSYDPNDVDEHIVEDMGDLLAIQKDRILQGYLEEKADGAGLSKDVSREMKAYSEMVALYKQAMDERDEITMKAKGTGLLGMFSNKKS